MPLSVCRLDNKTIPPLHKVLEVECHLMVEILGGGGPSDIDVLLIDIFSNYPIQFLI
jgi:hypothetical protein